MVMEAEVGAMCFEDGRITVPAQSIIQNKKKDGRRCCQPGAPGSSWKLETAGRQTVPWAFHRERGRGDTAASWEAP